MELCVHCGCPRIVHWHDGECLHCLAYRYRVQCKEFLSQPLHSGDVHIIAVNQEVLGWFALLMWGSGLMIGTGIYGIIVGKSVYLCSLLLILGILISGVFIHIILRK